MLNVLGKGKPIARFVKTDIYDKEILYLDDDINKDNGIKNKLDDEEISQKLKKRDGRAKLKEMALIKKALEKNIEPLEDDIKDIYKELKKKENDLIGKEVKINEGLMQIIPDPEKRQIIYVAGASGSGKSYFTAHYAKEYKKMFPDRKIIVFSKLDDDSVIDKLEPIRIEIDEELITDPIEMEDLKNSLVIFDDTDTVSEKLLLNAINQIKNDVLEIGRHFNISSVITSHLINNYKQTRTVLNESHIIVVYPSSGSSYSISYALKHYCGFSNEDVKKVFGLRSRWCAIMRHYPMTVIYEKGVYLLSKTD